MSDDLYRRTLRFAVAVAAQLQHPDKPLRGGHTVGEGYYYTRVGQEEISDNEVKQIEDQLEELVEAGTQITRCSKPWKEAVDYFDKYGLSCAKALLLSRVTQEVPCYECRGVLRLALHPLHDSLALLENNDRKYRLIPSSPGLIAAYAKDEYRPQPALLGAHKDLLSFNRSMKVECVGDLNHLAGVGRPRKDYVLQCEFRQEQKLAAITAAVLARRGNCSPVKVICIAGPTSSGKTTFANKLCMYLGNVGFVAKPLTVDHYYLPLDEQPKFLVRGVREDVDYDHIESMDVKLVGEHLNKLVDGKSVKVPKYNFKSGMREGDGVPFEALPANGILVIEGIHALNPTYTEAVEASKVFRIFISPLTGLQLDDHNAVKTTNHRLCRRMCRDYLFRAHSASYTLMMWNNVRRGEGEWIFPHQNNADFVMNSASEYELPVLKTFLEPMLRQVTPSDPNFEKAVEMIWLLDRVGSWPPGLTTPAALLREFIGDGAFDCH